MGFKGMAQQKYSIHKGKFVSDTQKRGVNIESFLLVCIEYNRYNNAEKVGILFLNLTLSL